MPHRDGAREAQGPHACPYCDGVAFGAKSSLKRHLETVHEKRRDHVCGYCKGVAFGRTSTLKAHIDVVHFKIKRSRGVRRTVGWK